MATSEVTTMARLMMSHLRLSTTARYSRRCAGSPAETAAAGAAMGAAARSRSGRSSVSEVSGRRRFSCDIIFLHLSTRVSGASETATPTQRVISGRVIITETRAEAKAVGSRQSPRVKDVERLIHSFRRPGFQLPTAVCLLPTVFRERLAPVAQGPEAEGF